MTTTSSPSSTTTIFVASNSNLGKNRRKENDSSRPSPRRTFRVPKELDILPPRPVLFPCLPSGECSFQICGGSKHTPSNYHRDKMRRSSDRPHRKERSEFPTLVYPSPKSSPLSRSGRRNSLHDTVKSGGSESGCTSPSELSVETNVSSSRARSSLPNATTSEDVVGVHFDVSGMHPSERHRGNESDPLPDCLALSASEDSTESYQRRGIETPLQSTLESPLHHDDDDHSFVSIPDLSFPLPVVQNALHKKMGGHKAVKLQWSMPPPKQNQQLVTLADVIAQVLRVIFSVVAMKNSLLGNGTKEKDNLHAGFEERSSTIGKPADGTQCRTSIH